MAVAAVVRTWNADEGWGVLDSAETPGGCWAHFGHAAVSGYVAFEAGQHVWLEWEEPGQDGHPFRAVRFWPRDAEPVERVVDESGDGYHSTLSITFDP